MNEKRRMTIAGLACAALCAAAPGDVKKITFEGKAGCLAITNGTARLVVLPGTGGRVAHYSRDGGPNFFRGGCRIDIGPELDYPPRHRPLWSGLYAAEATGPRAVRLVSPEHRETGVQLIKTIELAPAGAAVTLEAVMVNIGDRPVAYCLWDRTMTGAAYGFFPLSSESRFPARWCVRHGKHGSYTYDGKTPASPRAQVIGDLLVTVPGAKTEKVGADSRAGWIAGFRDGWLYTKRFRVFPDGDYADGGNTVEIWVNDKGTLTEIEPLSPKVTLKPGERYAFRETWDLVRVDVPVKSADDIPKLLPHVTGRDPADRAGP